MALAGVLVGLGLLASSAEREGEDPRTPTPLSAILATPDRYEGREVMVRGVVVKGGQAVFPNGRPYFTLALGDGRTALTVFSWERPSVKPGDQVEVVGTFHVWRYNLHLMVESRRITLVGP